MPNLPSTRILIPSVRPNTMKAIMNARIEGLAFSGRISGPRRRPGWMLNLADDPGFTWNKGLGPEEGKSSPAGGLVAHLRHVIEIGRRLTDAPRQRLGCGGWLPWSSLASLGGPPRAACAFPASRSPTQPRPPRAHQGSPQGRTESRACMYPPVPDGVQMIQDRASGVCGFGRKLPGWTQARRIGKRRSRSP